MVEYALEIFPDLGQTKRFQVRDNGGIYAQRAAEPDPKWKKQNVARRNRLTKRPTAVEYAANTENADDSLVDSHKSKVIIQIKIVALRFDKVE